MRMSVREEYEKRTEELILPLVEKNQFELVDVEYVKEGSTWYLRAYIDKEGGITVDDCEIVSRELSELLDQEDFIPDAYILEVSSPGLGRQLKKEKDFIRSIGKEVEIKLYKAIELYDEKGKLVKTKEFFCYLKDFDQDCFKVVFDEADSIDDALQIPRKDVAIIRLAIHF
jgi:ribosome maturation factor RimP